MPEKALKIGIAGLGTVGVGVIEILTRNTALLTARGGRALTVAAVSARSKGKDRGVNLNAYRWYDDPIALASDNELDIIVEMMGGDGDPAFSLCEQALKNGKHVVTANKALIAKHGVYLAKLAEKHNVTLCLEAAVAGGIPILKALKEGLAANEISSVAGIMNGTCNYILTQMKETGKGFPEILKEAQALGYAEADPTFDVEGIDTAHKLAILASIAFAMPVAFDAVHLEGITKIGLEDIRYADELGYKIKLLGVGKRTENGIEQRVTPCLVPKESAISQIDGVNNAVLVKGDAIGQVMLSGPGAGRGATASAVVADLVDIAAGRAGFTFGRPVATLTAQKLADIRQHQGEYYLRITVRDEQGVLAGITDALRAAGISTEVIIQKAPKASPTVNIVVITHETDEASMQKALGSITKVKGVEAIAGVLRVEAL